VKNFDPNNLGTLPIIPLCGAASMEVPEPVRATITSTRLEDVLSWIVTRMHAVSKPLIASMITSEPERGALHGAADVLISTLAKPKLRQVLEKELSGVIAD
jgi:hypothetical protein